TTYQWPAAPPCDGTLQQCIDAAASGDIVEIVTNDPIPESPEIDGKSLTLRAGAGFSPVFASPNSVSAFGSDEDQVIVIEGLTLANGQITAVHGGSGLFDVTIRNNVIQ